MITTPMPALNPTSTGNEMKLATKPSRSSEAATRMAPTMSVSVAVATTIWPMPAPGATAPSSAPVRMAIVVVVLTDSGRDVPSRA